MVEKGIEPLEKILITLAGIFSLVGVITAYILNWPLATQIWNATAGLLWILVLYQRQKIMTLSGREANSWIYTGH